MDYFNVEDSAKEQLLNHSKPLMSSELKGSTDRAS
jgi:hypothetical protein